MQRTKVHEVTINGAAYPIMWDNAAAFDFAEALGIDDINEAQAKLMECLSTMTPTESGSVRVTGIKNLAFIVHVAIGAGCSHKGIQHTLTVRNVTNAILGADGPNIITALVDCFAQYMPIQEEKGEEDEVGKPMAAH